MEWTFREAVSLASPLCVRCGGTGYRLRRMVKPCNCALRGIFELCYKRFRRCASSQRERDLQYVTAFCDTARRTLREREYDVFRYRVLLGANYKMCCRRLDVSYGVFYRVVHRMEQKLGRMFREGETRLYSSRQLVGVVRRQGPRACRRLPQPARAASPASRKPPTPKPCSFRELFAPLPEPQRPAAKPNGPQV